jgi:hypothetical protein
MRLFIISYFVFEPWGVINAAFLYLVDMILVCFVGFGVVGNAFCLCYMLILDLIFVGVLFATILFFLKLVSKGFILLSFFLIINSWYFILNLFYFSLSLLLNSLIFEKNSELLFYVVSNTFSKSSSVRNTLSF